MGAASPAGAFGCDRSPARQGDCHGVTQHLTGRLDLLWLSRIHAAESELDGYAGKVVPH